MLPGFVPRINEASLGILILFIFFWGALGRKRVTVEFSVSMQVSVGIGRGVKNPEERWKESLGKDLQLYQESRSAFLAVSQLCQDQPDK